jgi:hypothetical protein
MEAPVVADANASASEYARRMLEILHSDRCGNPHAGRPGLERIDRYLHGIHDDPYMPPNADAEYRLLAKRAVTNLAPVLVGTPAQALAVDNFRRGDVLLRKREPGSVTPEWRHWQESRLDARQASVHRAALAYGHSFTVTERTPKGIRTRGLSPLRTTALYEDPANDDAPFCALTVTYWPQPGDRSNNQAPGRAQMWDSTYVYDVTFDSLSAPDKVVVSNPRPHGNSECPVTRFAAAVDLDGRTIGVIEPLIPLQNRINQTVFDLLIAQTHGSFIVRTGTGMAPPHKTKAIWKRNPDGTVWKDPETGEPELLKVVPVVDPETGKPIPEQIDISARRFLFAANKDAQWGSLPATPLQGYIESIDMSIRHLSAIGQVPPHHLLGQIANLSAEALQAAEIALARKVEEFKKVFGESWERVFRLAAELAGDKAAAENYMGEVIWRDMEMRSLSHIADGLGKLAENLQIPRKGLWKRVPDVTGQELEEWDALYEEDQAERRLAEAVTRATSFGDEEGDE